MSEDKVKKLFSWEGWRKEIVWIVIFILIVFASYSYYNETKLCREIEQDPCQYCLYANTTTDAEPELIDEPLTNYYPTYND